ncbi:MAG TPA: hypothetical protein VIF62_23525, partial [Labilithrix sp.]
MRFFRAALLAFAVVACGSPSSSSDDAASDADLTKSSAPLSDAELAALFAKAPTKLSSKQSAQLVAATVNPLATTARLK